MRRIVDMTDHDNCSSYIPERNRLRRRIVRCKPAIEHVTTEQAARMLGIKPGRLQNWRRNKKINGIAVDSKLNSYDYVFPKEEVLRLQQQLRSYKRVREDIRHIYICSLTGVRDERLMDEFQIAQKTLENALNEHIWRRPKALARGGYCDIEGLVTKSEFYERLRLTRSSLVEQLLDDGTVRRCDEDGPANISLMSFRMYLKTYKSVVLYRKEEFPVFEELRSDYFRDIAREIGVGFRLSNRENSLYRYTRTEMEQIYVAMPTRFKSN